MESSPPVVEDPISDGLIIDGDLRLKTGRTAKEGPNGVPMKDIRGHKKKRGGQRGYLARATRIM
jgi:hypothetical protein